MAFNAEAFRAKLINDGARPNLFEVTLNFPYTIAGLDINDSDLRFFCKSAAIPGSTIGIAPVQYFGREVKLAGNRTFADWTVNIINDENFAMRKLFENWHRLINDNVGNIRAGGFVNSYEYGATATVRQYGKAGNVIAQYKMVGAWPTDIGQIDLDWGTNDTIEEFPVTFAYQYWESDADAGIGFLDNILNRL